MRISDWSSDVCSSDLTGQRGVELCSQVAAGDLRHHLAAEDRHIVQLGVEDEVGNVPDHHVVPEIVEIAERRVLLQIVRRCVEPERSEEHTSELQSLMRLSYDVFCLKKKTKYHVNRTQ